MNLEQARKLIGKYVTLKYTGGEYCLYPETISETT